MTRLTSLFLFFITIFTATVSAAAPLIQSISGSVANGSPLSISGNSFGIKYQAALVKWDDFENGTSGATLHSIDPTWLEYDGGRPPHSAVYSAREKHSGTLSAYNDPVARTGWSTNYYTIPNPTDEIFVSYWFKAVSTVVGSPRGYMVGKQTRLGVAEFEDNAPYKGPGLKLSDYRANTQSGPKFFYNPGDGGIPEADWKNTNMPWNKWFYVELYEKLSSPSGTSNGIARVVWMDGDERHVYEFANVVTRKVGYTFKIDSVWLGLCADNFDPSVFDLQVYIDDIYIDNTQARVEICNSPTFSNCTHCEMQVPKAWSDNSINITVNTGTFLDGETAYIFVIDSAGNVSNGYPIVIGGSGSSPQPPSNLHVVQTN